MRTIISIAQMFPSRLPSAFIYLYQSLSQHYSRHFSLEGLIPKTWAADIYLLPGIHLQGRFRSLAFLVQQTSTLQYRENSVLPSLRQGASQGCTSIPPEQTPGEAVPSLDLLCNVAGGRGCEAEDGNWTDRALAHRHKSSRLSWKGNRAALYSWKKLERRHLRFSI